ncbi:Teichoic acid translocation permease protein TagG [Luteitalea pratensis]|uniref:Transport permease protein n=2 Tax=Luteitalea pratensis TaxID=1855912 RepID=A0A143PQI8_LUTPR|nr:Teichoic acid translocation permease protein TagG [Luteitalea pratensis]
MMNDLREMVAEQVQYRELLYQMTKRDLLLRYKQTVMGFGWAVFMPLVNTAVFSVIFTRVAPIDVGMPYPLFAFAGLVTWNFFASSLKFAVTSLTSNTGLVTKVYFPREIFPVSAVLVSVVDFAVASLVLVGLMTYYRVGVHWTLLMLPVVLLVHLVFTTAVALLISMGNLFYRDVKYLFEIVLTVWMFTTAVLYPTQLVGGQLGWLMQWNPMTPIIEGYRDILIRGVMPGAPFAVVALGSVVFLLWAWLSFHRAEFQFAENI